MSLSGEPTFGLLCEVTQRCNLECSFCYCFWKEEGCHAREDLPADEVIRLLREAVRVSGAGRLGLTGGEPLLQIEFVTALFREAKRRGIHTCLDTSGATFRPEDAAALAQFDALCAVTDLVLLDIKQTDPAAHRRLTGRENGNILAFARYLAQKEVPVWVRHVVVPGLTDSEAGWNALGTLLASLPNVRALDVLPYHTMGRSKYDALGIPYPLEGTPAAEAPLAARARDVILAARRAALEKSGGRAEE